MAGYCAIDIFSRVCLGLITVVIVVSGIYSIVVLVKINRLIDEAAKTIRQARELLRPLAAISGIIVGLTKFSQFFRGKKEKRGE